MPRKGTITSELVVEFSHLKLLLTSSAVQGYQTDLPTSAYQGRGLRCNSFSLVSRQRLESPIHLGRNTSVYLGGCKERYPIEVDEILRSLYVDDIVSCGNNIKSNN